MRVNFRKERVSKVTLLGSLSVALALLAPPRTPELPAMPAPEPATLRAPAINSRRCSTTPRELRFEMLTDATEAYPLTAREIPVCLAVYDPGAAD